MKHYDSFKEILGQEAIMPQPSITSEFNTDWTGAFSSKPSLVLFPTTTQEVSQILSYCHKHSLHVVPQGGNSSLVGASVPLRDEIVLSFKKMNQILDIDASSYTATVQPGVVLQDLKQATEKHNLFFPLSFGAQHLATVGGFLSTNAGGLNALRYGISRDLCLGLEVVLADGRVLNLESSLRKRNQGIDLKHLFIGSEGTLGVITKANLKLLPQPSHKTTISIQFKDLGFVHPMYELAMEYYFHELTAFEICSKDILDVAIRAFHSRPSTKQSSDVLNFEPNHHVLLLELTHYQPASDQSNHQAQNFIQILKQQFTSSNQSNTDHIFINLHTNPEEQATLWGFRKTLPDAQKALGPTLKHDISLPLSQLSSFIQELDPKLMNLHPKLFAPFFGHVGDGNVHYNVMHQQQDQQILKALAPQIAELVYDTVVAYNGAFSAEHGIGQQKRNLMKRYLPEETLDTLQSAKQTFDPKGILNPHKVFDFEPINSHLS
ncbi:MAG: FAD-binding oxidoreductase [Rhodothermaceae bacterium TMED105]|nr:MAG: FAD-binding oxidoreductase [Rhodothermaceae bacterium TMED105]